MTQIPNPRIAVLQADKTLAEHEVLTDDEILVGRGTRCTIIVPHHSVALSHARLYAAGNEVYVEDLGAPGGTIVDGKRILGATKLRHGAQILVGQHAAIKPVVLRFEDPAAQLLRELGLPTGPEKTTVTPAAAKALHDAQVRAALAKVKPVSMTAPLTQVRFWAGFVGLCGAFGVAAWMLLEMLRPSSPRWRSVQISPAVLTSRSEMLFQSPDIDRTDRYDIAIAGQPARPLGQQEGKLAVEVPELEARSTGRYDVPLVVNHKGVEIYSRMLVYVVQPEIAGLVPASPRVGDRVRIRGAGFATDPSRVRVRFGDQEAPAISSQADEIEVQVPVLTRVSAVQVPLSVTVDEYETTLAELVEIQPRPDEPLSFRLRAEYAPDRGAWRVNHPLGPAFYLAGNASESGKPPATVQATLERFEHAFRQAASDPSLRVDVDRQGDRIALIARGQTMPSPLLLASWDRAELVRLSGAPPENADAELLSAEMATVWNDFLETFARGNTIPKPPDGPQYVDVLNRLVQTNRAEGGRGRPDGSEIEALGELEKTLLSESMLPTTKKLKTLDGHWIVALENVFDHRKLFRVRIDLDLTQSGRALAGTAQVVLLRDNSETRLAPATLQGELNPGSPNRVRLEGELPRPIGKLLLQGPLDGATWSGTFQGGNGDGAAKFRGLRKTERKAEAGDPAG